MYAKKQILPVVFGAMILLSALVSTASAQPDDTRPVRIATFNVSLYGKKKGQIRKRLSDTMDSQARKIASIVQTVRPDILLVNELDYESDSDPAKLLAENYFAVGQPAATGDGKLDPIEYPFLFSAPSNTGIDSEMDLNQDGKLGTANDAWGYGVYPGQYSMTVYSRFPIESSQIRSFQKLLWKSMPGAMRPIDPETDKPYYNDQQWNALRLSSKNHIDVPINVGGKIIHVLASHPTPPVFDGPEDRNGLRNHDEIEFWNQYLSDSADWIVDDAGRSGGLAPNSHFVVMGDLNADPVDGSGRREAINKLISHPLIASVDPQSDASGHGSKTANFGRNGFMRVDFVLPSKSMPVTDSGVFWPSEQDPTSDWVKASDHRLVWVDVK